MPQLTFPIANTDLLVDVRANLDVTELARLRAANSPPPASVEARGLLDTGTDVTGVAPHILQRLGAVPRRSTHTHGIGGSVPTRLFHVSLSIWDASQPHLSWFTIPQLSVMELSPTIPFDVLIGMDVLLQCRMLLDGPSGVFTLDF
jgi:hypothetical protein